MTIPCSMFALEMCLRFAPESSLHRALHQLVIAPPVKMGPHDKRQQYHDASAQLLAEIDLLERGCWDYFDDDARARREYEDWCSGMFTEVGDRLTPEAPPQPYRGEPRYLTFTMALLVIQGSPSDEALLELSRVPRDRLWWRETFVDLLRGLMDLTFTSVKSDVIYLIPRDEAWALRSQDLSAKRFDYLREVIA